MPFPFYIPIKRHKKMTFFKSIMPFEPKNHSSGYKGIGASQKIMPFTYIYRHIRHKPHILVYFIRRN